jgi:23S rRNA (cytidine1920-2'-O)/16S rRNA (cytidine1409-2'-O)-methyltransferase
MTKKSRLDTLLVQRGLVESRARAQAMIMAGLVYVEDVKVEKAGQQVDPDAQVTLRGPDHPYVSRGGVKLAGGLDKLGVDPSGLVCIDVGQSTGGFTDCLLSRGATKVYGIDVGYGQLAMKIRNDPRVVAIERTNFRKFDPDSLPEKVDLVVSDASFISLTLLMPVAVKCCKPGGKLLLLIKPQFEVGKKNVGAGGVVREPELHKKAVDRITNYAKNDLGLEVEGTVESPIQGPKGNREFFCLLSKKPDAPEAD